MNLDQYQFYKKTNIPLFKEIPSAWKVVALQYVARLKSGSSITALDFDDEAKYPVYGGNGFRGFIDKFTHEGTYVLIGRQGALCGNINITKEKFFATEHALVVTPTIQLNTSWLAFTLTAMELNQYSVSAAQPGLSAEVLARLKIALPSIDEQQKIAEFLDYKTAQIDALIAKKESLLLKLQEKCSALITQAVTKGINPNVPMKPSGVEWLGEVPAHWDVLRIKHLTAVRRGASPRPIDDPKYFDDDGEYAWVRIADVSASNKYLNETTQKLSVVGEALSVKLQPDELFLSIAGSVGKPIITKIKCCIHDGFVYFPNYKESKEFLYYIFASGQPYLGLGKLGTQLNLNTDTVGSILIGLPGKEEQQEIVDYIEENLTYIGNLATKIESAITKLQEYRSALITNAVTGKIDVRDFELNKTIS